MITFIGTHETVQTAIVLPDPQFGDSENNQHSMTLKRSINGNKFTYVKNPGSRKLIYSFYVSREKGFEIENFVKAYYKYNIRMYNHKNEVWIIKFTNDVFDFQRTTGEHMTITLEMEGTKI